MNVAVETSNAGSRKNPLAAKMTPTRPLTVRPVRLAEPFWIVTSLPFSAVS